MENQVISSYKTFKCHCVFISKLINKGPSKLVIEEYWNGHLQLI